MADGIENPIKTAKRRSTGNGKRPRAKNHPLTTAVLHTRLIVDPDEFRSLDQMEAQIDWLTPRIAAMDADRADELAVPQQRRDERFLAMCGSKLRAMRNLHATLSTRRKALRQAKIAAENKVSQARRERLFISAVRDALPPETFQALWDRVDSQEIEATGTELAA